MLVREPEAHAAYNRTALPTTPLVKIKVGTLCIPGQVCLLTPLEPQSRFGDKLLII